MFYNLQNLSRKLKKDIFVFDIETTGISKTKDCIVEFGYTLISPTEVKSDNILIKPPISISQEVSAIHGITNEMVGNCPSLKEVIMPHLITLNSNDILVVGYNSNSFDIPFLQQELERHNIQLNIKSYLDVRDIWMSISGLKKGKLFEVATNYGISLDMADLHRTQADVFLTAQVCDEMLFHHGFDYIQNKIKGDKLTFSNPTSPSAITSNPAFQQDKINFEKAEKEKQETQDRNNKVLSILMAGFEKNPDYVLSSKDLASIAVKMSLSNFDVSRIIGILIDEGKIPDKNIAIPELQKIITENNLLDKAIETLPENDRTKLKPMLLRMKELLKSEGWQDSIINKLDYWQLQVAKKNNSQNTNSAFK